MLSIGIRSGKGFDKETLAMLIEAGRRPYEYDVLILGTNPGGMVCARETARRGKKVALVSWRIPTPGEEEGQDEDERQMAEALQMTERNIEDRTNRILGEESKQELVEAMRCSKSEGFDLSQQEIRNDPKLLKWSRKVRKSRQDLKNSITNMASEGLAYMHEVAMIKDITTSEKILPMSWGKMMEQLLDHLIKRNWIILTDYVKDRINVFTGKPILINDHTIKVMQKNGTETTITAEKIISAVEVHNSFPKDVIGAREFGVNGDDFFRLSSSPGKTLVVGGNSLGLEFAGILSTFHFPVSVVYRTAVLKDGDDEVVDMIVKDLMHRGVKFIEKKALVSIQRNLTGNALLVEFTPSASSAQTTKKKYSAEYDTVLFATKEKPPPKKVGKTVLQLEMERLTGAPYSAEEKLMFRNIVNINDQPGNPDFTKLSGRRLGQQLFGDKESQPKDEMIPNIVLTPLEYAYIGVSGTIAKTRLGSDCVDVFTGYFQTEDVIPETHLLKDDVCFAKVVTLTERDMVLGLHLLGRDAVQIMYKILQEVPGKLRLSNLHSAIRNLMNFSEVEGDQDEKFVREHKF